MLVILLESCRSPIIKLAEDFNVDIIMFAF